MQHRGTGVFNKHMPILCRLFICGALQAQEEIRTWEEFAWGISAVVYGLVWCCCIRRFAKMMFPKALWRLMGLARVGADFLLPLFLGAAPLELRSVDVHAIILYFCILSFHPSQACDTTVPSFGDWWAAASVTTESSDVFLPEAVIPPSIHLLRSLFCLRSKTCSSSEFCLYWCSSGCASKHNSFMQRTC